MERCEEKLSIKPSVFKFNLKCCVRMMSITYVVQTYLRATNQHKFSSLYRNRINVQERQKNLMQTCSKCIVPQEMYLHKWYKWIRSVSRVPYYSIIILFDQYHVTSRLYSNPRVGEPFTDYGVPFISQNIPFAGQICATFGSLHLCIQSVFTSVLFCLSQGQYNKTPMYMNR
jgi:hypothetical protein